MKNIPEVKLGIVAVSRDCFPMSLSEGRRSAIVNEYKKNDINIYHFDVYRLEDSSEFYAIGGDEYFENGICLIEWGELIQDALPNEYIKIDFSRNDLNENERVLNIKSIGKKYDNIIESLKGE